jgi:hypothetical protein
MRARGEAGVHHPAVTQDHDEDVERLPLPAHLDGAALAPIDLGLLPRQRLETLRHPAHEFLLQRPDEVPEDREPAGLKCGTEDTEIWAATRRPPGSRFVIDFRSSSVSLVCPPVVSRASRGFQPVGR